MTAPQLRVIEAFATDAEIAHVIALAEEPALRARGIAIRRDQAGFSCELPIAGDAVLEALARRMEEAAGLKNALGDSLRFRRYRPGESHPPHLDSYRAGALSLAATAMLYLTDCEGGETSFPEARPEPIAIAPRRARLVTWRTLGEDGREDPAALHEALEVRSGEKITLTDFIYVPRPRGDGPRFHCVTDDVPEETTSLLRAACEKRGVQFEEIDAPSFDWSEEARCRPGDLLYRAGTSLASIRVEQFLWAEGAASFHADPGGPFFESSTPTLLFERAGLPVPRTHFVHSGDRDLLRAFVEDVGGLPVVLKLPGGEGGVGVLRADSLPALFSLVDHLLARGDAPLLAAYVDRAVHHRVVVVGDRAVATYRNAQAHDDFRSAVSDDPREYSADVPPRLSKLAVKAARAIRRDFAGVDLLEHPSGRLYLLEANFPCYFPQAERAAGIDVSGAMVEFLLAKAARFAATAR